MMTTPEAVPTAEECDEPKSAIALADLTPDELAKIAADEHQGVVRGLQRALAHALRAGDALLAAKSMTKHGEWMDFVARRCPGLPGRTATHYMRLAENRAVIEESGAETVMDALAAMPPRGPVEVQHETISAPPVKPNEITTTISQSVDCYVQHEPSDATVINEIKPAPPRPAPVDEHLRQTAIALAFFKEAVLDLAQSYRKLPPEVRREAFTFVFEQLGAADSRRLN